ncbi:MAG TPA: hypothetical protein VEB59_02155 [Gemmatimonadales bacterium]|nr:hypothetical protein [Gemmatimonadales bacterium]
MILAPLLLALQGFTISGGTIDQAGRFTAPQSGTATIIVTYQGLAATATVRVASGSVVLKGLPFGPFGAWDGASQLYPNTAVFTSSHGAYTAGNILDRIAVARAKGLKLVLAMTGGARAQYLTNGVFDIAKWRAKLATYNTAAIRSEMAKAVADGVIVGNSVMDEPFNTGGPGNEANSWGPPGTMTKARIDQMCTEVKAIFPTLSCGVFHDARSFEPTKSYRVVEFLMPQYRTGKGEITAWRDEQLALCRRDHHGCLFALNLIDGGQRDNDNDGVWECPLPLTGGQGSYPPNCRMTTAQAVSTSKALAPFSCGALIYWRYDAAFMALPANQAGFREVAAFLAGLPPSPCRRSA